MKFKNSLFKRFLAAIFACLYILAILAAFRSSPFEETDESDISSDSIYYIYFIVADNEDEVSEIDIPEPKAEEPSGYPYTDEEIDLISICTMAEAEGEPELGQRLVIDTILNRLDSPYFNYDTIHDVIYAPNQFSSMSNGRADRCYVKESIRELVIEEIDRRTDDLVLYFRTGRYHSETKELYKIGNHYFSTQIT